MTSDPAAVQPAEQKKGAGIERVVSAIALLGGFMTVGFALVIVISVVLRSNWLALGGIPGDFELVQMLTAMAVFAFLPLCQHHGGHVIVDAFSGPWPSALIRKVDGVWEIVAFLVFALMALRLGQGAIEMSQSNTKTMVLGISLMPAVAVCAGLCGVLAGISLLKSAALMRRVR